MTLLAVTLVAFSTAHSTKPVAEVQPQVQTVERSSSLSRLTPQKREWFERAIDRILKGD